MDPPTTQGKDPYDNDSTGDSHFAYVDDADDSFPDVCGSLRDVLGSEASLDNPSPTQNYGVPLFGMPLKSNAIDTQTPTQTQGVPLFGMPLKSNPTPPTNPIQSSASPPQTQAALQRDRTFTDESETSTGSVSKKTLVKLMREQVDLVRRLTNAQIAQKAELERVKEEKRMMEEAQQQQAKQAAKQAQQEAKEVMKQAQQQQQQMRTSQNHTMSPINEERQQSVRVQYPAEQYTMPPTPPLAFRPPPARIRRDTSDSDGKSVASVSVASLFKRPPDNRYIPLNVPKDQQKVRRHPDALYFKGGFDENTTANGDPSQASTIKFPTAIVIGNDKRNRLGALDRERSEMLGRDQNDPAFTGPGAVAGYSKDRIEITHIPERNVVHDKEGSCANACWWAFSRLCTVLLPDFALFWVGRDVMVKKGMSRESKEEAMKLRNDAKQAWREKVAIFIIMLLCCSAFIAISGVIPMVLCRETRKFTMDEIQARVNAKAGPIDDWTVIYGTIYDVEEYQNIHPGGPAGVQNYIGQDASKMFPRRPPGELPLRCLNMDKNVPDGVVCASFDEVDQLVNLQCHTDVVGFSGVEKYLGKYERGVLAHRPSDLKNDINMQYVSIYDRVYNVTGYLDSIMDETTGTYNFDSDDAYLHDDLNTMIKNTMGEDATAVYEALYDDDVALSCLDDLFYVGILDERPNIYCHLLSLIMYAIMIAITGVLAIQCFCSIIYIVRWKRTIKRDDTRSKMIIMVPCYNEGDKELRKTIDSVMDTSYPDDNKVLLVIADGNITGKGERCSTPETLSRILGYKMNPNDKLYSCKSIGELTENRAKIQYGTFKDAGKELKYIVIVKCGVPSEEGSPRAGNRGKRDSQLLFSGLLNRFHHGRALNELDKAIKNTLEHLQLPLDEIRFLMAIDADTRIDRESLSHMTYSMNKNDRILALCGETKVDNKSQSWVTMIQVFEYYTNHHMKKAFESVFGCVTCLPGCFTMYRLFSDDGRPLLSCDDVYQRYATNNVKTLHDKNLYHLGEDRMLTTLLLRYFPDMRLSFVPEAFCYTIVPHTFSILLSQRRRWINSTFHNMLELLRVNTMCGVCCFSMKSIVLLDLIATLILPASLLYVGYIVYITVFLKEPLSLLIIIMWGIVIGVQVVAFLLRSRWDYWWWFFVFVIVGVPVFYFILPLYSFWHMDDFSWGTTRQLSSSPTPAVKATATFETLSDSPGAPVNASAAAIQSQRQSFQLNSSAAAIQSQRQGSPANAENVEKLNLKPKLNSAQLMNSTADDTTYDPNKYRNAEEAKQVRRLRRAEC